MTSSSSSSSSSSGSSSCSDTGSSSSSESSSSADEKNTPNNSAGKNAENNDKTQVNTRRRSSESKAAAAKATSSSANSKLKSLTANAATQRLRTAPATTTTTTTNAMASNTTAAANEASNDALVVAASSSSGSAVARKNMRPTTTSATNSNSTNSRRRSTTVAPVGKVSSTTTSVSSNKTEQTKNSNNKMSNRQTVTASAADTTTHNKHLDVYELDISDDSDKQPAADMLKVRRKAAAQRQAVKQQQQQQQTNKRSCTQQQQQTQQQQPATRANATRREKVSEQETESDSSANTEDEDGSSISSDDSEENEVDDDEEDDDDDDDEEDEDENSESSNSFAAHHLKATRGKRPPASSKIIHSDSDEMQHGTSSCNNTPRKLTRSFSTRQPKQQLIKHGLNSDSDSDIDFMDKHSLSRSPGKKPPLGKVAANSKCKVKKELMGLLHAKPRSVSPPQLEKKCPIEGCDSTGHLSGNLDKHFLPEACPIYHNMSASECKERANERKQRNEQRSKSNGHVSSVSLEASDGNMVFTDKKDILLKIRESRANFKPLSALNIDKVKLEKDCNDEDREPSLLGLVPDYDLQLFREAQAIASEQIEDKVKELPVGKGIKYITMGKYKMKVWYQSPYPDDASRLPQMFICEFCLRYQKSEKSIKRHALKCVWRHPPGDEIYRKGKLQVWQVDGKRHKQYCQHLCLLAKFFLDHKTLYYDVEPFLFYIMTLADSDGCHTVGYFSKEKNSFYNVSCILTLPPYQRKGYGRLLIDFSYLLTRVEGKVGSPEKPLSDLGLISYRSYWKDVLLDFLCNRTGNTLSIKEMSQEMAIYSYDIVSTLQALGMMKYWKGKHIVLKKQEVLDEFVNNRVKRRGSFPKIDKSCLRWRPFVPTQSNESS